MLVRENERIGSKEGTSNREAYEAENNVEKEIKVASLLEQHGYRWKKNATKVKKMSMKDRLPCALYFLYCLGVVGASERKKKLTGHGRTNNLFFYTHTE